MTDADLIHSACLRAEVAIMAEVERIDAAPWWAKLWANDHKLAALLGAAVAVCSIRESIADIMAEERR